MTTNTGASSLSRPELRAALTLSGIAVLRMVGLFMLLPVLALWATDLAGATPWLVGVAVSAYGLSQAALQIPFGALSDRIGRRPVVLGALSLFVIGSLVAGFAESLPVLIAGRVLQGAGAVSAALSAWLADASRPDVRVRVNAIFGASIGASFALSLIVGPLLAAAFSVRAVFFVAAGLGVVAMLLVLAAPGAPRSIARRPMAAAVRFTMSDPGLAALVTSVFGLHAIIIALFVVLPTVLAGAGLAPDRQWQLYLIALVASLFVVLPSLRRAEGAHGYRLAAPAWLAIAAGLVLATLLLPSLAWVTVAMTVFFIGFNFLEASLPAWVSLLAPQALRGACLGVFSTAQFLGAFCGGLLGAWLLTLPDVSLGPAILGGVGVVPALGLLLAAGRSRPTPDRPVS